METYLRKFVWTEKPKEPKAVMQTIVIVGPKEDVDRTLTKIQKDLDKYVIVQGPMRYLKPDEWEKFKT